MDSVSPDARDEQPQEMNDDGANESTEAKTLRTRLQFAGIVLVAIVYLGGIAGWTYATLQVESSPTPPAQLERAVPDSSDGQGGGTPDS